MEQAYPGEAGSGTPPTLSWEAGNGKTERKKADLLLLDDEEKGRSNCSSPNLLSPCTLPLRHCSPTP
ncbi:GMC_OxRdtase_N domain-containing protein [Psidium guajava]|nr:GMC_OxRdtase_N domain-containing protein [Psidium guajava]